MKSFGKPRIASGGASSPARRSAAFGGFSSSSSSLSYVAEPPDLSGISEANIVVSFKNLQKKDETTKAKALEDLVANVQEHPFELHGGVEDAVLDAWVHVYPRISIDNSRRVRELSHALQLDLVKSARRRMEKRIPTVVGAWLAGTFDRDRAASRAASDGLSSFLNSPDKVLQFWRRCQAQILDYATAAALETPDSLSDDRSTSRDDADAKYYRVMGASLSLVLTLLQKLDVSDHESFRRGYDDFFAVAAVWNSATCGDAFVRRTTYQLLWSCLDKREASVRKELPRLGRILVSDALKANQTGSAAEYLRVLTRLTQLHPEIWGEKKQPLGRLRSFIEKGSQGSATSASLNYWKQLDQLLAAVPQKTVSVDVASDLARSLRTGIAGENRNNVFDAWATYLSTTTRFISIATPETSRTAFVEANVYPLVEQYLWPPAERSPWSTGAILPLVSRLTLSLAQSPYPELVSSVEAEWTRLAEGLASRMTTSLPEVSKAHPKSQQEIADAGERWFSLAAEMHSGLSSADADSLVGGSVRRSSQDLLQRASELLVRRNYKPFGVASLIASGFVRCPYLLADGGDSVVDTLFPTADPGAFEVLATSPSLPFLLPFLGALAADSRYSGQYEAAFTALGSHLISQGGPAAVQGITVLLGNPAASGLARRSDAIQRFLLKTWLDCATGRAEAWDLLNATLAFDSLSAGTTTEVAEGLVALLNGQPSDMPRVLRAIEVIAGRKPEVLTGDDGMQLDLLTKLLEMTSMSDAAISGPATAVRSLLDKTSSGAPRLVRIIQDNLESTSPSSVSIDKLAHEALELVNSGSASAEEVLPSTNAWMTRLSSFLQGGLNPALSLTSGLGGAYLLTTEVHGRQGQRQGDFLVPTRMACYTAAMMSSTLDLSKIPRQFHVELLYLLYLVAEIASDEVALQPSRGLSAPNTQSTLALEDLVFTIRRSLVGATASATVRDALAETMLRHSAELTPLAVYTARALSEVFQTAAGTGGFGVADEERIASWDILKATPATALRAIAVLTGFGELLCSSKHVANFCNRLVSDVAGMRVDSDKAVLTLALLNASMSVYPDEQLPIASNRVVFAVKRITTWFEEPVRIDSRLAAESCRALQRLLPHIKDVYGPYWSRTIRFCINLWERADSGDPDQRLPYVHSSVKLVAALQSLSEPNDDLVDALDETAAEISSGLLALLSFPRSGISQPETIVDALLRRRVEKLSLDHIKDVDASELYGLVGSESRDIQMASFGILHRVLPAAQQQLSMDVLLEKRDARLPDELLSLLLDAPTLEAYPEKDLASFPTPVRSYLLSWHLVFDAYANASLKVRNDYTEHLKSMNHVDPLLTFTFDVLGHTAGHPLNLDKEGLAAENITSYDARLAETESDEKQMHWLLVHVYYLTLKYIPGLFKAWYLDCKSKQTKLSVESWTTKYITPIITSEMLDEVQEWANSQEPPPDDEKELLVRVSNSANTKEVIAGYEVDELTASMAIRIPPSYPIDVVSVVGINRVAVSEKKWQNWLLATQGVILFSNGSIIDGLLAFRRNVVGALKGQTECAICYSIISTDKKMPDRRCGTCRNLFHRTCLYKWFQTSSQNTCPLCRNPIDYLGADTSRRRAPRED